MWVALGLTGVDPGFPVGVPILGECQHMILPNFPKNCMELRNFGPRGAYTDGAPPPWICQWLRPVSDLYWSFQLISSWNSTCMAPSGEWVEDSSYSPFVTCKILKETVQNSCAKNSAQRSLSLQMIWHLFLPAATKLGQGNVFTGVCDSVHRRGRGGLPQCMLGCQPPRTRQTPGPGRPPRDQTAPCPDQADPPREADASIQSMSGRYASYWNAFLLL